MENLHFKMMAFMFKIRDHFNDPKKFLEENVPLGEGSVVLDYGCGPGSFSIAAAEIVGPRGKVFAVDILTAALSTVDNKAQRKKLVNIKTIKAIDGYKIDLGDEKVDVIFLFDAYHLITKKIELFKEFQRVLRKGGKIYTDSGHLSKEKALTFFKSLESFTIEAEGPKKIILRMN